MLPDARSQIKQFRRGSISSSSTRSGGILARSAAISMEKSLPSTEPTASNSCDSFGRRKIRCFRTSAASPDICRFLSCPSSTCQPEAEGVSTPPSTSPRRTAEAINGLPADISQTVVRICVGRPPVIDPNRWSWSARTKGSRLIFVAHLRLSLNRSAVLSEGRVPTISSVGLEFVRCQHSSIVNVRSSAQCISSRRIRTGFSGVPSARKNVASAMAMRRSERSCVRSAETCSASSVASSGTTVTSSRANSLNSDCR